MSTNLAHEPDGSANPVTQLPGIMPQVEQVAGSTATEFGRANPEGRYLASYGKAVHRRLTDLKDKLWAAMVRANSAQQAWRRAELADAERRASHRGGERSWLLRWFIAPAIVAEAATAFVAMEALVRTALPAIGLSVLAALIGAGLACLLANRRLNHLPVPRTGRILETIFVIILTVLRFESLFSQSAGVPVAVGAAALAAIISALALVGIEEIVVETCTFGMFLSSMTASRKRSQRAAAAGRLAGIEAEIDAASRKLEQHFLEFLLKVDGLPLEEALRCAAAFRAALMNREA